MQVSTAHLQKFVKEQKTPQRNHFRQFCELQSLCNMKYVYVEEAGHRASTSHTPVKKLTSKGYNFMITSVENSEISGGGSFKSGDQFRIDTLCILYENTT